ncbi:hypothetical protein BDV12DRAFT_181302 [Aspergillus spectabilis]
MEHTAPSTIKPASSSSQIPTATLSPITPSTTQKPHLLQRPINRIQTGCIQVCHQLSANPLRAP